MKHFCAVTVIILIAAISSCEQKLNPHSDHTSIVYGSIWDAESKELLDTAFVAFAYSAAGLDDSVCFDGDTIKYLYRHGDTVVYDYRCRYAGYCVRCGRYRIQWFLGPWPLPYENMYAVKRGYKMWRFDPERDRIIRVGEFKDSLDIYMHRIE